jgi:hypothetical protein
MVPLLMAVMEPLRDTHAATRATRCGVATGERSVVDDLCPAEAKECESKTRGGTRFAQICSVERRRCTGIN